MTASRAATVPLADSFEPATEADWLRLVEKTLRGRDAADLVSQTTSGIGVAPLYTASGGLAAARTGPGPDGAPWDIRAFAAHPDAAETNRRLLEDLEGGATSVILVVRSQRGGEGLAARSEAAVVRALEGVDLHLAEIALDAGFLGPRAADWLDAAAKAAPRARLGFHFDPISAFAQAGRSPGPIASHLALAAERASRLRPVYPLARLFLASGRSVHEAGGSDADELAFAAASAVAYAKAQVAAGQSVAQAFAGLTVGVSLDADYFTGMAKLRGARLMVGRIAQACGAPPGVRIEARSSRRMLSKLDPWTNLLRLTVAGFAGAVGGAEALALEAFTQPLGAPSTLARRLARNSQLILMEEAQLGRVADPGAGSGLLDTYTQELVEAAWRRFQAIEARGGIVDALQSGLIADAVADVRTQRQAAFAAGEAPMIGVNLHPNPNLDPVEVEVLPEDGTAPPDAALPGQDDTCPALVPVRWSEPFESLQP